MWFEIYFLAVSISFNKSKFPNTWLQKNPYNALLDAWLKEKIMEPARAQAQFAKGYSSKMLLFAVPLPL